MNSASGNRGHGPVHQRRFFQIAEAVIQVQDHPIAAERHLARDFGVGGIGVIQQRGTEQSRHIDGRPEHCDKQH
jgi:hypothetical protein